MNVAVLHDLIGPQARPDELDNLHQAEQTARSLDALGHEARLTPFHPEPDRLAGDLDSGWGRADRVFNLVESCWGASRLAHLAPALLEHLGRAYTGGNAFAFLVTGDKVRVKEMLRYAGLPTPAWHTAQTLSRPNVLKGAQARGSWLLKPVYEHGSVGLDDHCLVQVDSAKDLAGLLDERRAATGLEYFAELYVDGREFNMAALAGQGQVEILPAAEMTFVDFPPGKPRILGYESKWQEETFESKATRRSFGHGPEDKALIARLKGLTLAAWVLFELSGYGRVDFRVDDKGNPFIIDVNPNPCLAEDAGLAAAAEQAGLSHADLVGRILAAT